VKLVPFTLKEARAFVAAFHRHNRPPLAGLFAVALAIEQVEAASLIVGCAIAGRPVSRALDDGFTLEVTRTCTSPDAPRGAVSMLYGACRRAAGALGYRRCLTYTLAAESGASLRGAGWKQTELLRARGGWDCPTRRRGAGTVDRMAKVRWEIAP
jgi:hypothetical protein